MPALVNSKVASLPGTSELDGTIVWPLEAKKSRKSLRISALVFMVWRRLGMEPDRRAPALHWAAPESRSIVRAPRLSGLAAIPASQRESVVRIVAVAGPAYGGKRRC